MALEMSYFLDSVPKSEVARYWSLLDASIIHLRKTELFTTVIPSKIFECMAMGIPLLHGVSGKSARSVEGRGRACSSTGECRALCGALTSLAQAKTSREQFRSNCLAAAKRCDRAALARAQC